MSELKFSVSLLFAGLLYIVLGMLSMVGIVALWGYLALLIGKS